LTWRKSCSWWSRWFTTNRRLNIAFSTSTKALFRLDRKRENDVSRPGVCVKFRFLDVVQEAHLVG
jgi:hypothetical protein